MQLLAEHLYRSAVRLAKADHGVEQHRLARPGAADHRQNLAALDREIQAVVHHVVAEAGLEAADLHRRSVLVEQLLVRELRFVVCGAHMSSCM